MSDKNISRRQFLVQGSKITAGLAFASTLAPFTMPSQTASAAKGRVIGANDRINVAVIGIRGRGQGHIKGLAQIPNVCVKTLVDLDENLFAPRVKKLSEIQSLTPSTASDLRRVLDDKDIDAVSIATTDHWHAIAAIWACQAGKHVYVEKPCSQNIWESRKMVEAARKYNRIMQVGFQSRAMKNVRQAIKFLHDGGIGEIYMARGLCFKPRDGIGKCPDGIGTSSDYDYYIFGNLGTKYDSDYMKNVDYNLWLGPAPKRPFNYNRFHYNWHWFWDYGCGDIGNQGPHQLDIARWGMNENEHPVKIKSAGNHFVFDSDQQTPNTQVSTFEYADGKILQFEVRGIYTGTEEDVKVGNFFYGSKGWMVLNSDSTWKTYFGRKNEPGPSSETATEYADPMNLTGTGGEAHFRNFTDTIRSGKRQDLTCDIEQGHISSTLPHLANISYRLGREVVFDGKKEKIVGDRKADKLLTRKYRKPFIVPEKV